jgi:CubicO group peptidase (beta-lactamase class C family)
MIMTRNSAARTAVALLALATSTAGLYAQAAPVTAAQASAVDAMFAHFDRPESPGCIVGVGRAGTVLFRKGYGMADLEHDVALSPRLISEIGSVSKQFTAAAVVLLAQDGRLSLDDEVRKHYPAFPDFGAPVTIRQLLNHTSGLRDQFGLLDLVGRPNGETVSTVDEVVDLALRQRSLNFTPNTEYLYSNTGYTFLNKLVEHMSGRTFTEFTTERIFTPLGMPDTQWRDDFRRVVRGRVMAYRPDGRGSYLHEMPFSNLHGSGGLLTTVDDLITWTNALHADRVGRPGLRDELMRTARLNDGRELSYALGLVVSDFRGVREVGHGGSTAGYRAHLVHYPGHDLTVALQCNVTTANAAPTTRDVAAVFLADHLQPEPRQAEPMTLPAGELERRAGVYYNPVSHQVIRLVARDGRLIGGGLDLVPIARDRFRSGNTEYEWTGARAGRPAGLRPADGEPGSELIAREVVSLGGPELAAYAADYHNDELDSTITVVIEEDRLVLRYPMGRVEVEPAFRDAFAGSGRTILFTRDAAGNVTGFAYHAGRVRNIRFDRRR